MKSYIVQVTEIRSALVTYVVSAGSIEEATGKAAIGDTIDSFDGRNVEVTDRIVMAVPEPGDWPEVTA